jgi:hypothetical protein
MITWQLTKQKDSSDNLGGFVDDHMAINKTKGSSENIGGSTNHENE